MKKKHNNYLKGKREEERKEVKIHNKTQHNSRSTFIQVHKIKCNEG